MAAELTPGHCWLRCAATAAVVVMAVTITGCTESAVPTGDATGSTSSPSDANHATDPTEVLAPLFDGTPLLLMWARGGLPDDLADRAGALPGVLDIATFRSDTLGLVASADDAGDAVDVLPEGFQVPLDVTAVDPEIWIALLGAEGEPLGALLPGTALATESFASSRSSPVASVTLAGAAPLRIVGTVPDGLVGGAELIVHAEDAENLGITRGPSLVVRHSTDQGADRLELMTQLQDLMPANTPARIVDTEDPAQRRDAPLVLSLREVKALFGTFAYRPRSGTRDIDITSQWITDNIVRVDVPLLGSVRCHRGIIDDLRAALEEIEAAGLGPTIDPDDYAGCWTPRRISAERASVSHHAWGIALDINVDLGLPGGGAPPDDEVIAIFGRHGFRWGGDFIAVDNHHFEWVGGEVTRLTQEDG